MIINMPQKVSIHIPAFNAERTINECIDSLFNQTVPFDEIIVVNDFSSDKTLEILKKYKTIKIINNKMNMGLSYSRNQAIKNSRNEIIASIDADVILEDQWLEKMLFYLNKDGISMCGGKLEEKLTNNKFNLWRAKYYSQNWGNQDKLSPNFLFGCNTLQKKSIWQEIGGYNENFKTNGEDIDYSNKIKNLNKGNLFYCANAKCFHLQNDNLESLSNRVWRYHAFGYKIKEPSFKRLIKLSIKQFKFMINRTLLNLIKFNLNNIYISAFIFIKFIELEYKYFKKK